MSCPRYVDNTRAFIQHFPQVLKYSNYKVCEPEEYHNCLAYLVLKMGLLCKYNKQRLEDITKMHILVKKFIEDEKTMELFKSMIEKYCTSEKNHSQCACFKLFKQSIHPPI